MIVQLLTDDGKVVGTKSVPDSTIISEIHADSEYIAQIRWTRDDIALSLEENGIEPTQCNIDEVINSGLLKGLEECSDQDWEIIHQAIGECERRECFKEPHSAKELLMEHETLVSFIAEDDIYRKRHFIVEDYLIERAGGLDKIDIAGAIEDTLHVMLDSGLSDKEIEMELGAFKDGDESVYPIDVDLGYRMAAILRDSIKKTL